MNEAKKAALLSGEDIVLQALLHAEHYLVTTDGLYVTDRPDLVEDKQNVLWRNDNSKVLEILDKAIKKLGGRGTWAKPLS